VSFNPLGPALNFLRPILPIIINFWWLWLFLFLFFIAKSLWLAYAQEHFRRAEMKFVLLELKIPREVKRSPRAMEQIFYAVHSCRNEANNIKEKWWDGEVTMSYSFEVVRLGGELQLYLRLPAKYRNVVEANFYAQYPDIEIAEVEDYVNRLPLTFDDLRAKGYQLFGNELRLAKPDVYPIRSYVDFEEIVEERQLDPIAALLEMLNKLDLREDVLIQIIVRPNDSSWKKEGEATVKKIKESSRIQVEKPYGTETIYMPLTKEEVGDLAAMERNISKPGFDTLIRYLYIAPTEVYSDTVPRRGVYGAFNQYASESLNKFIHNTRAWTRVNFWYFPHLFPKRRQISRQRRIYNDYRVRRIYEELKSPVLAKIFKMTFFHWGFRAQSQGRMVLNTEELATIFHLPTNVVLTGPLIKRVEARKIGPPAGLPIYGESEEDKKLPGVS